MDGSEGVIHLHRYQLVLQRAWGKDLSRATRRGALLRFRMQDGVIGYADLFAWPELGDANLDELLSKLSELNSNYSRDNKGSISVEAGGFTDAQMEELRFNLEEVATDNSGFRLLPRLVDAALAEAKSIRESRPLLRGAIFNHRTILSVWDLATADVLDSRRAGHPALKVKTQGSPEDASSLARLQGHWRMLGLRLDFNERANRETLLRFLDRLPIRILQQIDFLEDPFPFSIDQWRRFHIETGIRLALDRPTMRMTDSQVLEAFNEGAAQVYIHKPHWTSTDFAKTISKRGVETVVTSALGHPIGNLYAASVAQEVAPDGVHGCLTHNVYRQDEISNLLTASKQFKASRMFGNGIGCGISEKSLHQIHWTKLSKNEVNR